MGTVGHEDPWPALDCPGDRPRGAVLVRRAEQVHGSPVCYQAEGKGSRGEVEELMSRARASIQPQPFLPCIARIALWLPSRLRRLTNRRTSAESSPNEGPRWPVQ